MRKTTIAVALLTTIVAVSDCDCSESLSSSVGALHLELCDHNAVCGCELLGKDNGTIEFGLPKVDELVVRTLLVINDNAPRPLNIERLDMDDPTGGDFKIVAIQKRSSSAPNALITEHDMTTQLQLVDDEEAEVLLGYQPSAAGDATATLTIVSNSSASPRWELSLRAGAGDSFVDVKGTACPGAPLVPGATNCDLIFDEKSESDIDRFASPPLVLGTESIVITNSGDRDLFVGVELTNDGVPELDPSDFVGDFGVFSITQVQCSILEPTGTLSIDVDFAPFNGGPFVGEVKITGLGADVNVGLIASVIGSRVCIRTEDEIPDDAELVFGDAPTYSTAAGSVSPDRNVFIQNCGYGASLDITDVQKIPTNWNDGFYSADLDPDLDGLLDDWSWTPPAPIAVGAEIQIPFRFAPTTGSPAGLQAASRIKILSNAIRNQTLVDLRARVGVREQCLLVASPHAVNFGWVADDFANQSPPLAPNTMVSSTEAVVIGNVGQKPCTNVRTSDAEPVDPIADAGIFSVPTPPAPFTLNPGDVSAPIDVLFAQTKTATPETHFGTLPFTSDEILASPPPNCDTDGYCRADLIAQGGGDPDCALTFQPTQAPGYFCQQMGITSVLAFGNVNIGQQRTIDVKVLNTGSDRCDITNISISGGNNTFTATPPAVPFSIPVNSFVTVPVTFLPVPPSGSNPFEEIGFNCLMGPPPQLSASYSSPISGSTGTGNVAITGNGTKPDIDVIPGDVDFGAVTVGCCSANVRVAIYNQGNGPLTIDSIGYLGSSDPGFQIPTAAPDLNLAPGEDTAMEIRWCATAEGTQSGVLEIIADAGDEYFTVSVTGEGTLDSQGSDAYQQPERPMVDVLFVVDDSGSMGEEQTNLANNFDTFINTAVALDTDYHLGVINTESESDMAGKLYSCNGPLWISDTQPTNEQRNQFKCNVKSADWSGPMGGRPNSDSKESGLQAARLALDYPNLDGFNLGFYREEATLYIIIITDEVDQSDGTAQQYVDYFKNLKGLGNPDLLNISAITGPPPNGCTTAESNDVDYDAVNMVGGQFLSICTPDWSGLIGSLGLDVFNARRQFPLSRPADGPTIGVQTCTATATGCGDTANCSTVPQDSVNGWTYDSTLNSITFNGTSVPGAAEHICVDYVAFCFQ